MTVSFRRKAWAARVSAAAIALLTVVLLAVVPGALGSTGNEALSATPTQNLPDTGLTSVAVDGTGFVPGAGVQVQQCSSEPGRGLCVGIDNLTVEPDGTFATSVSVSYDMRGFAPGSGPFCNTSPTETCQLQAVYTSGGTTGIVLDVVPLTFAGHVTSDLTWVVNTTTDTDDGACTPTHCSLREAIDRANGEAGTDTIGFDIAGAGPHTIQPTSALPAITDSVVVDGTSEPDFAGTPVIELDGQLAGAGVSGVLVTAGESTIRGLVVNRFGHAGIHLLTNGGNLVVGNRVGLDVTGTLDRGNTNVGIHIQSSDNTIGGTTSANRNVVAGNNGPQIAVEGVFPTSPHDNVILGNYVGTNATGTAAGDFLPRIGVVIQDGTGNRVGGMSPGEGNLISGNSVGLRIANHSTADTVVQGNLIGTAANGTSALGNNTGVDAHFTSQVNTIGGTTTGAANTIAFNFRDGVLVYPNAARLSILGNSIHSNFEQGIDLLGSGSAVSGDGVTPNDPGDADAGGNNRQNYPLLTGAAAGSGETEITGSLDTAAGTYRIEFFSSAACDTAGGNGEGRTYLGFEPLTTGGGTTGFTVTLPVEATVGQVVTATATAPDGSTSELSGCVAVTPALPPAVLSWTVGTTDDVDDGACTTAHCSLREAIDRANDESGLDTVSFDIPGAGPHTIRPTTGLPTITDPLVIDGTTEPDFTSCAAGPVVELDGSTATSVQPSGLDITAGGSAVRGLVINRWAGNGISLRNGDGNTIECNFVGTNVGGTADLGNAIDGIRLFDSADNTIGGATPAARNLISGNQNGIQIRNPGSTGNRVVGNLVGTDVTGTLKVPDSPTNEGQHAGVWILFASGNSVGGTAPGEGNVLGGGQYGVSIDGTEGFPATGNLIQGNFIGTDPTEAHDLGNFSSGVLLFEAGQNTVGGTAAGAGNVIARNGLFAGVNVQGNEGGADDTGNSILGNSIYANADAFDNALGVDLGFDGATENDAGDGDEGPNNLHNHPELTSAVSDSGSTVVSGSLDTVAGTHRVELFSSPACDPSGNGEGKTFLGFEDVLVDGDTEFTATLSVEVAIGHVVTATATAPDGSTSELSPCVEAVEPAADLSLTKTGSPDPVVAGEELTYTLTVDNAGPAPSADVEVSDTLPPSVTFVSASDGGSETAGVVHWDLGTVAAADPPRVLTLVVRVDEAQAAAVENSAEVTSSSDDPDPTDDTAAATTAVDPLTLTVNTTDDADDGACSAAHCSLREAIHRANGLNSHDVISFDIQAPLVGGVHTISPASPLPQLGLSSADGLDATTEPDFVSCSAGPVVELEGSNAGSAADGLRYGAPSVIRGLIINGFDGPGRAGLVLVSGTETQNVECNYIGTDATGTVAVPNTYGVLIEPATRVVLGGPSADQRNLISGNGVGVYTQGSSADIQGNYIGTDVTGAAALGNGGAGVLVEGGSSNTIGGTDPGAGNVISGNQVGIRIEGTETHVAGNLIGTDATGTAPLGNSTHGIQIANVDRPVRDGRRRSKRHRFQRRVGRGRRERSRDRHPGELDPLE